jgi:adenylate cyclase
MPVRDIIRAMDTGERPAAAGEAAHRPATPESPRRTATILAADAAGYSRLMSEDEVETFRALQARRTTMHGLIAAHGGRIANTAGDSVIAEFPDGVAALGCALAVQGALAEANAGLPRDRRLAFRIGINAGPVFADGADLLGDAVNVAARLQAIADPGGVCLSDAVRAAVAGALPIEPLDLGFVALKHIARPVRVWRIPPPLGGGTGPSAAGPPQKPSLAVLPFSNLSADAEQDYFCDGVTAELTTALSRLPRIFVVERSSAFRFRGHGDDIDTIARELDVRYLLQGSVRRAGERLRIHGHLVDAATGRHIWDDRFDGEVSDVFDLQDRIAEAVVAAVEPRLHRAELERARRKRPADLDAYDCYLRGLHAFYALTPAASGEALSFLRQALDASPGYAPAAALAARCYVWRASQGWTEDPEAEREEAVRLARLAVEGGRDDSEVLFVAGHALAFFDTDLDDAEHCVDRSLELNPSCAQAWTHAGWTRLYVGRPTRALPAFERAVRLGPADPMLYVAYSGLAAVNLCLGEDGQAAAWAQRAVREDPKFASSWRFMAATAGLLGRTDEAAEAVRRLLDLDPGFTMAKARRSAVFRHSAELPRYLEGLRRAGLPEG